MEIVIIAIVVLAIVFLCLFLYYIRTCVRSTHIAGPARAYAHT